MIHGSHVVGLHSGLILRVESGDGFRVVIGGRSVRAGATQSAESKHDDSEKGERQAKRRLQSVRHGVAPGLQESEFEEHRDGEIVDAGVALGARDGERALSGEFGKKLGAAFEALDGAKGRGAADAEVFHGFGAAADDFFLGAVENPFRSG